MPIRDIEALETMEKIIASLTLRKSSDPAIDRLIASIQHDRARLLSSQATSHTRGTWAGK